MIKSIIEKLTSIEFLERLIAFLIDITIAMALSILPMFGWLLGIAYFIWRDSLPFTNNQSFGKSLYQLKVVENNDEDLYSITKEKSFIRNMVLLIPFLNVLDVIEYLRSGERLADRWTMTKVIKISSNTTA